jgi:vacuolar-type H+-ATPase subunit I/STV1
VRGRIALTVTAVAGLFASGCNTGVPGFCHVSDNVRVAIGNADPSRYPAEVSKHIQELKDSADSLSGAQSKLAEKVVREFAKSSEAKANSLEFTNLYNQFVRDSNKFGHKYCNETEPPDF